MSKDIGVITIDADDVSPGNPTEGFGGASVKSHKAKSIKLPKLSTFDPNFYPKPPVYRQRDFWWGLILEKLTDDSYEVSLQDNQIVTAYCIGLTGFEYQEYQLVLIGYDSSNDRYGLITPPDQKYSRVIRGTCTENVGRTDTTFIVNNIQTLFADITVPPDKTVAVHQIHQVGYSAGEIVTLVENERDGTWENIPGDRNVGVDDTDKSPSGLASKFVDAGTFDADMHEPVLHQATGDSSTRKVKLFVPKASVSGGVYIAGCGVNISGSTISFKNTDVAGFGLASVTPGCTLKVYPEDFTGCGLKIRYPELGVTLIDIDAAYLAGSGLVTEPMSAGPCETVPKLRVNVGNSIVESGLQINNDIVQLDINSRETIANEYYGRVGSTYGFYAPNDRKVAASDTDTSPSTLINKIANHGTYGTGYQLVYAQLSGDGSTISLFTAEGSSGGLAEVSKTVLITTPVLGCNVVSNGTIIPRAINGRQYIKNDLGQWVVGDALQFWHIHPDDATQSEIPTNRAYVGHVVYELGIWKLIGSSCSLIDYTP